MARIFLKDDEPMLTFFDFLSSVSSRDYQEPYSLARIEQVEEALRLQGILPTLRMQLGGANQRKFVAALIRFSDEDEITKVPTRNGQAWADAGFAAVYVEYLDSLAKENLIKYNRETKCIRPTASLQKLTKLSIPKAINFSSAA